MKKQQKQYETRMVLTVPTRGVITIEGSTKFVRDFFIDVKSSFVQALADALKYDAAMKGSDFEVIQTEVSPRETKLEIVEKSATTNQVG